LEIDEAIDRISSKCNNLYKDSSINTICNNYQKTYEKLINLYIGDLLKYNELIEIKPD